MEEEGEKKEEEEAGLATCGTSDEKTADEPREKTGGKLKYKSFED